MAPLIPFIPLIAAGVGVGGSLIGGKMASDSNANVMNKIDGQNAQQNTLIQQLMSGIDKNAYMAQAGQAGEQAMNQLGADDASKGILSSGAHSRIAAQTLGDIYANATAKYQSDRQNAIGMAIGGRSSMSSQYAQQFNPNPYSGLQPAVAGVSSAGATYLDYLEKQKPKATP